MSIIVAAAVDELRKNSSALNRQNILSINEEIRRVGHLAPNVR